MVKYRYWAQSVKKVLVRPRSVQAANGASPRGARAGGGKQAFNQKDGRISKTRKLPFRSLHRPKFRNPRLNIAPNRQKKYRFTNSLFCQKVAFAFFPRTLWHGWAPLKIVLMSDNTHAHQELQNVLTQFIFWCSVQDNAEDRQDQLLNIMQKFGKNT